MATKIQTTLKSPDYWADPYGWAVHQAVLLRAGRFDEIDLENIAEEIDTVGRNEFRSLKSNLSQILLHMLKWDYQPELRSRSWMVSIAKHRIAYSSDLSDNPSLKPRQAEALDIAYRQARQMAEAETGLRLKSFPVDCPYDWAAILERQHEGQDLP
jgi:hypothetical protein